MTLDANPVTAFYLLGGMALLIVGADILVHGASRLAALLGLSPVVIGLTVVAYGTSSPEIAVNLGAALEGRPDIGMGNILGSNISNILLVLGISSLIAPVAVTQRLIRLDVPIMIAVSVLVSLMGWDGRIGRLDGMFLMTCAVVYTAFLLRRRPGGPAAPSTTRPPEGRLPQTLWQVACVAVGIGLVALGARWVVRGGSSFAEALGLSELIVGLTIVALGTSLPELATSVAASFRGRQDLAVGNAVGSNIFNLLLVLGLSGSLTPGGMPVHPATLAFDFPVMIAASVACLPIFFTGNRISRWEGGLFVAYYLAYLGYLLLDSVGHDALPLFNTVMLGFALPITALTLAILSWGRYKRRKAV